MSQYYSFVSISCDSLKGIDLSAPFDTLLQQLPDTIYSEQVARFGITIPVLVQKNIDTTYSVLSGFCSVLAAQELGLKDVLCKVILPDAAPYDVFSLQIIYDNLLGQTSPIQRALLLNAAQEIVSEEELFKLCELMGLKANKYQVNELLYCLQLDFPLIRLIHKGVISVKNAKKMGRLDKSTQKVMAAWIEHYTFGGSKQNKLIDLITELTLRSEKKLDSLFHQWQQETCQDTNLPQEAAALLRHLEGQCYPRKTAAEEEFKHFVQQLGLPEEAELFPQKSFEDDSVTLSLHFEKKSDIQPKVKEIRSLLT